MSKKFVVAPTFSGDIDSSSAKTDAAAASRGPATGTIAAVSTVGAGNCCRTILPALLSGISSSSIHIPGRMNSGSACATECLTASRSTEAGVR